MKHTSTKHLCTKCRKPLSIEVVVWALEYNDGRLVCLACYQMAR